MGASEIETKFNIGGNKYSVAEILAMPDSSSNSASSIFTTTNAASSKLATPDSSSNSASSNSTAINAVSSQVMGAWLGAATTDSITKCNEFLARVSVQRTGWDTGLDILALATGGAAAVAVLPTTTASALAASSTFATGTRSLIDSDVYGQVGSTLIISEIRQDYYPAMHDYVRKLIPVSGKDDFVIKYAQLLQNHGLCSLQMALYKLTQKSTGYNSRISTISPSSLKDGQKYLLIDGSEIVLSAVDKSFQLKGYGGDPKGPIVIPMIAASVLNGEQAKLEP
jgi:hypothetical protein